MEPVQIGVIRTPYNLASAPRQGRDSKDICEMIIFDEFSDALLGLGEYEYLIVLYWLHLADRKRLRVVPPDAKDERGVFATRSPHRPNPIGLAVVKLIEVSGNVLRVIGIDAVDGTPLLDIKPYFPDLDCWPSENNKNREDKEFQPR